MKHSAAEPHDLITQRHTPSSGDLIIIGDIKIRIGSNHRMWITHPAAVSVDITGGNKRKQADKRAKTEK